MALKELSIRGDFRTPVEFLIDVLEAPDFIEAAIHTEWLDGAIARRQDRLIRRSSSNDLSTWTTPPGVASSECSNIIIAVLCAAAIKAITSFSSHETAFIEAFRQGIILPSNRLSNVCAIDLQHQDMRYLMEARRVGPSNIVITANKSSVELYVRNLKDNGYLVTIGQRTLHVHASSDALGIQLTADGKSYLMEEACDRNALVAPTSGKLVRFLCPNGAFVEAGVAYAEMEVFLVCEDWIFYEHSMTATVTSPPRP